MIPQKMSLSEMLQLLVMWRGLSRREAPDSMLAFFAFCLNHVGVSHAQLLQDLWVGYETSMKSDGYFVEIGGGDGRTLSNSYMLEQHLGWEGLVAEPAKGFYPQILQTRRCKVDNRCVWSTTGETLMFNQAPYKELSTLDAFTNSDSHGPSRQTGERYLVDTVSLTDLLLEAGAPQTIDYLSIDTEGSELDILSAFDFGRFDIRLITVEHNFTAKREGIFDLLSGAGFRRKFENLSLFDDWYVRAD